MSARTVYRLSHQYFRRRLNAGGQISPVTSQGGGAEDRRAHLAAYEVVASSGRKPAPVWNQRLHYPHAYLPNSQVSA